MQLVVLLCVCVWCAGCLYSYFIYISTHTDKIRNLFTCTVITRTKENISIWREVEVPCKMHSSIRCPGEIVRMKSKLSVGQSQWVFSYFSNNSSKMSYYIVQDPAWRFVSYHNFYLLPPLKYVWMILIALGSWIAPHAILAVIWVRQYNVRRYS